MTGNGTAQILGHATAHMPSPALQEIDLSGNNGNRIQDARRKLGLPS